MTSITKSFLFALMCLCLGYLGIQLMYNHYAIMSVDEFWFAHRIYEYASGLPYRDFAPYKTILGYYLLLPPMLSGLGNLETIFFTKDYLAILNMGVLFVASVWLSRFFSYKSVLISLAIMLCSEIMISYSTQLRVDLIGYWFGLFAVLLILEKRYWLAGVLLGLGFCTTQKVVWYLVAGNCGMIAYCHPERFSVRDLLISAKSFFEFNLAFGVIVLTYLATWAMVSDWNTVINSVFHEASAMYRLDWYNASRTLYWHVILLNNPLLFLSWPIALFSLFITFDEDTNYSSRLFITIFSMMIMLCLIPYKQVFPYYMQVTLPVFFLLYASLIDWLIQLFKNTPRIKRTPFFLQLLFALYTTTLIITLVKLSLPWPYLLIAIIPLTIILYTRNQQSHLTLSRMTITTVIFMGFIYPLSFAPVKLSWLNGEYQQTNVKTVNLLLQEGGDYVAGIELIYNKTQPIAGLRHLMAPAVGYLYSPTPKLREVMLASLYEDPNATVETVIDALKKSSVKFYVNNYRMNALPKKIHQYLDKEYAHWWGSVYLYAPVVESGNQRVKLKFDGKYVVDAKEAVELNGKLAQPKSVIYLNKSELTSNAKSDYRLRLVPVTKPGNACQSDEWEKLLV